ncbi:NUDIX hydrolase [Micromonospora sp. WMMD1102]|uniref:NUDIX hydrolase n=1 Tax=Micromonospora sp. WMMD1102 TaxID=3016105 RepID=UPI0024152305|nr:NUDIX hydrolase [Micromonospora sp. WMMD1102]MDG4791512.1 NUDIX hydrolase [Micromonospora sp. WMMD1102]
MTSFAAPESIAAHARRFYAEGETPAPPRPAATVLLLRPDPSRRSGFEVYMIRRAVGMTFGGMYAFPGGSVDPGDSEIRLDWSGPDSAGWGDRLGLAAEAAQAVVCAAAREIFEEAGVLLAGPHPEAVVGDVSGEEWERARQALVNRRTGFADLLRDCRLTLRSDLLLAWSRWITPEVEPRRFDTYFFVALLPAGQRPRDVSGEADHTTWIRPADALARTEAGEISMLPPTMITLAEIAACPDLAAVPAAAAGRNPAEPILPRIELAGDLATARIHLD